MAVTLGRDALELEAALRRLGDVVSCRVVTTQHAAPAVELILKEGSNVPATRSAAAEVYQGILGQVLSAELLTLRTLGPPRISAVPAAEGGIGRPRITTLAFTLSGQEGEARVGLESGGVEVIGERRGSLTQNQRLRFIAEATLSAAEQLMGTHSDFTLESVADVDMLDQRVIVVLAHCFRPLNRILSGSSPVHADDGTADQAVVRATLDAINRLLSRQDFSQN